MTSPRKPRVTFRRSVYHNKEGWTIHSRGGGIFVRLEHSAREIAAILKVAMDPTGRCVGGTFDRVDEVIRKDALEFDAAQQANIRR